MTMMMKSRQSGFFSYFELVDSLMKDTVQLRGYQGSMAGFLAVTEYGDTIVHKQTIIVDDTLVYYLNNIYDIHISDTLRRKGDAVLSTFLLLSH